MVVSGNFPSLDSDWLKVEFSFDQWKASEYGLENDISVERNITFERMQQLFKTAQVNIEAINLS